LWWRCHSGLGIADVVRDVVVSVAVGEIGVVVRGKKISGVGLVVRAVVVLMTARRRWAFATGRAV